MTAIKPRKKRVPKLCFMKSQDIGWYVSYRDPGSGQPRRFRFGNISREEADLAYHDWIANHLRGKTPVPAPSTRRGRRKVDFTAALKAVSEAQPSTEGVAVPRQAAPTVLSGSLLHIASGFLKFEESRARQFAEARRQGSIHPEVLAQRKQFVNDFLEFLNGRHGHGTVGRMMLADLKMEDAEEYNRTIVKSGYSNNGVVKRLQVVKNLIDRAGRPEFGSQILGWNWDSRDVVHGFPAKPRALPTLRQLKLVLEKCLSREKAMVWMAIGLGFGQGDLAVIRVGQIDEKSYDLRRGKTGIERYGETPAMVWKVIGEYLKETPRAEGELLFTTRKGMPLVHENADSVQLWWYSLRKDLGKPGKTLSGFYCLRHLGATEFGSRPGCSISDIKRWLGHGASSQVADVYMRPVGPEHREVVECVRKALLTGKVPNIKLS
jgi:integrase